MMHEVVFLMSFQFFTGTEFASFMPVALVLIYT
jgi:hypothetical protein